MVEPSAPAELDVEPTAGDHRAEIGADLLGRFVWRRAAGAAARETARAGVQPEQVILAAVICCTATFLLWRSGWYWTGIVAALGFLFLETVANAIVNEGRWSRMNDLFTQAIDFVHPPLWWAAWLAGLDEVEHQIETVLGLMVLGAIIFGHVAVRFVERIFVRRYAMAIHDWRPIDGRFNFVCAARQTNLMILTLSLLAGRPDLGIELVALWTLVSLVFQAVRLAMANDRRAHGEPVTSWLA